jgi:hypothetical protein
MLILLSTVASAASSIDTKSSGSSRNTNYTSSSGRTEITYQNTAPPTCQTSPLKLAKTIEETTPSQVGLISILQNFDFINQTIKSLTTLEYTIGLFVLYGQRVLPIQCVAGDQYTLRVKGFHEGSLNDVPLPPPVKNRGWILRNLQLKYENRNTNRCAIIPLGILLANGLQRPWIVVMDEHYDLLVLRPSAIDEDDDVYDPYADDNNDATPAPSDQEGLTIFDANPLQCVFRLGPVSLLIDALDNPKQVISPQLLSEVIGWSSTAEYLKY